MWSVIAHGGAKEIPPEKEEANRKGMARALEAGCRTMRRTQDALESVIATVKALEDNPTFNAGKGGAKRKDGTVELCGSVMTGHDLQAGAVASVPGLKNPVEVARLVHGKDFVLMVGMGAYRFAAEHGAELADHSYFDVEKEDDDHDTVGCVALDPQGRLAVATSTGGLDGIEPGRVGDSPLPGSGFYADDQVGAISISGDGEFIARAMMAARVMIALEHGQGLDDAVKAGFAGLSRVGGEAGCIVLTPDGKRQWRHNSSHFAVAYCDEENPEPKVFLRREEDLN
jgi:L-asparaginase / beta-aspartyl-peptidase